MRPELDEALWMSLGNMRTHRVRNVVARCRCGQVKAAMSAKNAGSVWDRFMAAAREIVGEVDAARIEARVHQGSAR